MLKKMMKTMAQLKVDSVSRKELAKQLAVCQRKLIDRNQSMVILLDGFESSGRADIMRDMIRELDPRYFEVKSFSQANDQEKQYPFLRRFVHEFPGRGHITIFDRSFYYSLLNNLDLSAKELRTYMKDLRFMEDLILNDDTILCKFFLVQSKKAMEKRVAKLHDKPLYHFFKDDLDKKQLHHYDRYLDHFDQVIEESRNSLSPWTVVLTDNIKEASRFVLLSLINGMTIAFQKDSKTDMVQLSPVNCQPVTNLDLTPSMSEEDYDQALDELQDRVQTLVYQMYEKKKSGVIVFEGTDAAGKGGAIKRLTRKMDPRIYKVATTAKPTKEELDHHYLWRFYKSLPAKGHVTIFDRSWYGRVLVEPIEGFTPIYRCQQAYEEINNFESSLVNEDFFVLKFLICISKEEQYARFMARKNDIYKQYKLTDEDWRNHEKFDQYQSAMDEMVARTSTQKAPWILVSGSDKKYARIQVLRHFIDAAEKILKK